MLWILQLPGGLFLSPSGGATPDINQAALYESAQQAAVHAIRGARPVEYARAVVGRASA